MITNDFTLCMLQFYTPLISQKFAGSARGITLPSYIKNRRRLFLLTTLKKIVLQILSKDRLKYSLKLRSGEFKRRVFTLRRLMARGFFNGGVNSTRSHPPPTLGNWSGICHFVRPGGREFVSKPLPGVRGAYVNSSKSG